MQPKPFDVNDPRELAAWKKWMNRFEDPDAFADDEPQKMSSQVARGKPIRHQAVDILRAQNGGYRPSEDNIQAEIVRLSAMQHISMNLQPGTTKNQDGKTYVLNENHRWTRPDLDDGIDAYDTQGVLDFVAPPRKQGDQDVLDFEGEADSEESDKQDPAPPEEYKLKTEPLPVTQIAPNGKEYAVEYAPGDLIFDQSAGMARIGRVVGYTEDPGLAGQNLLVQFTDADEEIYVSPNQVLGESDFGRGKEKGTWKDAIRNRNNVKIKGIELQVTNQFRDDGSLVLKKGGLTFEYGVHVGGFGGSSYFLREVDKFGNVQSFKEGKFSKIDPLSKQLGVSSLGGLRWLQSHDPQFFGGVAPTIPMEKIKRRSLENFKDAFQDGWAEDTFNSLRNNYYEGKTAEEIQAAGISVFPKLDEFQMARAERQTAELINAVEKGYNSKAKSLMSSMARITLYPNSKMLALFASGGKELGMQGCMISGAGIGDDPDRTGYEQDKKRGYVIDLSSIKERLKGNYLCLTPDNKNLKTKLMNHYGFPEETVDSYQKAAYPTDEFNPHDQEHTWLHEFGHAIDGPYHVFSKSPEWQKLFKQEIIGKAGNSRIVKAADKTMSLKAETKLEDLKPGDVVIGSRIGSIPDKYQDENGNLKVKSVRFHPETHTRNSNWEVIFESTDAADEYVPAVYLATKNHYGEKNGIVLADAPDGAAIPLSMYAMTDPREGWAEFAALIARRPDKAKQLFPKAYRFWQKKGLV